MGRAGESMRRDLSLIRRLEKIEKELGYCQIKLEKEQRLTIQARFLSFHRGQVSAAVDRYRALTPGEELHGNRLGELRFPQVQLEVGTGVRPDRVEELHERFRSVGLVEPLEAELVLLDRELGEIREKLGTFSAFHSKKEGLQQEHRVALRGFQLDGRKEMHRISEEFERIEHDWNILTEDLMNYDEALFHVSRVSDYLTSARNFILGARSQFSVEEWVQSGYLIDLFKHSPVGRTREMVEGADRNLKLALRELLCLEDYEPEFSDFEQLLLPFIETLFDDLFLEGRLVGILKFVEVRLARANALRTTLEERREAVYQVQSEKELTRERLFQQIGDERRKLSLVPPL